MKTKQNNLLQTLSLIPYYPIVAALYPVFFLWMENYSQTPATALVMPLVYALIIAAAACLAALLLTRNIHRAGVLAGFWLVLVFSYGHIYNLVEGASLMGVVIGRHRYMLAAWVICLVGGSAWILLSRRDFKGLTRGLNLIFSILLVMVAAQTAVFALRHPQASLAAPAGVSPSADTARVPAKAQPDVYYFLLDGYDREDRLASDMDYDNEAFLSRLQELGFVIPGCTQSNYNKTIYAMATTLNMEYLDALGYSYQDLSNMDTNEYTATVTPSMAANQVMENFRAMGYQVITLKTIFSFINFPDSDVVYDFQFGKNPVQNMEAYNFQELFLRTTVFRVLLEQSKASPDQFKNLPGPILRAINPKFLTSNYTVYQTYQQGLYQFDQLERIAQVPGPKFLYAHIMLTHRPFAFEADGSLKITDVNEDTGYTDQISYLNARMLPIIENILAQSATPPVIIVQGDHAYGWEGGPVGESFLVLNAYYLPGAGKEKLYPTITPVNTFRLVFSEYFGLDYPLLADRSIWVTQESAEGYQVFDSTCVK